MPLANLIKKHSVFEWCNVGQKQNSSSGDKKKNSYLETEISCLQNRHEEKNEICVLKSSLERSIYRHAPKIKGSTAPRNDAYVRNAKRTTKAFNAP